MAEKKKKDLFKINLNETEMEIHIFGESLLNHVYQQILELMKVNRESEQPKSVRFIVYSAMMSLSVRYAVPSEFYDSIVVSSPGTEVKKEVLKDAACM